MYTIYLLWRRIDLCFENMLWSFVQNSLEVSRYMFEKLTNCFCIYITCLCWNAWSHNVLLTLFPSFYPVQWSDRPCYFVAVCTPLCMLQFPVIVLVMQVLIKESAYWTVLLDLTHWLHFWYFIRHFTFEWAYWVPLKWTSAANEARDAYSFGSMTSSSKS